MKRYSFLSLALVGAAGITAAFAPSKSAEAKEAAQESAVGRLTASTGTAAGAETCVNDGQGLNCTWTATAVGSAAGSATTGAGTPNAGETSLTNGEVQDTVGATTIR
ncbi:hypothetical protein [uncultured Chitinophaga sp.]|uniref:hypothetical protein n=1 Tax=uncultured Chitinophaga sp. TaxID=339340 RepID=UPI0025E77F3B|nr:hypothetical protein [uncultured Chitinophaga sp.]